MQEEVSPVENNNRDLPSGQKDPIKNTGNRLRRYFPRGQTPEMSARPIQTISRPKLTDVFKKRNFLILVEQNSSKLSGNFALACRAYKTKLLNSPKGALQLHFVILYLMIDTVGNKNIFGNLIPMSNFAA